MNEDRKDYDASHIMLEICLKSGEKILREVIDAGNLSSQQSERLNEALKFIGEAQKESAGPFQLIDELKLERYELLKKLNPEKYKNEK